MDRFVDVVFSSRAILEILYFIIFLHSSVLAKKLHVFLIRKTFIRK